MLKVFSEVCSKQPCLFSVFKFALSFLSQTMGYLLLVEINWEVVSCLFFQLTVVSYETLLSSVSKFPGCTEKTRKMYYMRFEKYNACITCDAQERQSVKDISSRDIISKTT